MVECVLNNKIKTYHLSRPNGFGEVIEQCQILAPSARPTFGELGEVLTDISENLSA
eukprot:m.169975 g.169975  ORF g.169975 m.169975 type:complete len:56 (+) comp15332_c0_seq12:13-180(+)